MQSEEKLQRRRLHMPFTISEATRIWKEICRAEWGTCADTK